MGARILFRDSQGRDGEVRLEPAVPCYVGRALECAIRTDDAMVSRKHSAIRMEGNRYVVEDLGSSNGTHVNNTRVTKQALNHNDVVQCGSLWLRYVEDGPLVGAQPQQAQPQPAPGKVGGTARLDVAQVAGHPGQYQQPAQAAQPVRPQPYQPQPYQPPGQPGPAPADMAHARTGYGGPAAVAPAAPAQPMAKGPPSLPPPDPRARPVDESSVVVDMADPEEIRRLKEGAERVQRDMDELRTVYDREVADGKRMRAESSTLRDRIEELRRNIADRDEQVVAHQRVAEELRAELGQTKGELSQVRGELAETAESVSARERQLNRAQDDVSKLKEEMEDLKRQLVEVSKTKDEGWRKLNEQLGEIEHLREVINEQERMLEERRVGLVSQEQVIKELRAEKERTLKDTATLRAERDEHSINAGRYQAQINAIDEENKRLSRMMVESQTGKGASAETTDHTLKLADELKQMRVELRKLESDRDRVQESADRNEKQVDKLDRQVAKLEIDLREANDRRDKAEGARAVAEEAMTKAEVARHKSAEEAIEAARARDTSMSTADEARRELDRSKRRVKELEAGGGATAAAADNADLTAKTAKLERELKTAQGEKADAERGVKRLEAELEAAKSDARHAHAALEAAQLLGGDAAAVSAGGDNVDGAAVAQKATEVHDGINDVLSELRNNIVLIQNEFGEMAKEDSGDSARIIRETLEALLGNAEDAKGVLRTLKELVEYGN